ncbi:MAG TPA: glycerol-3-phosphate dehydrogenase, partial [Candidatus Berkiella sp.]|nr:glycerol-3-phosphate dehydrogenase [Candidatus Berkiella sp.]
SFWLIRLGLFIYDIFGYGSRFQRSKTLFLDPNEPANPLKRSIRKGFVYSDATVDDARLVITTALRLERAGGMVANYTRCISAVRLNDHWQLQLQNQFNQQIYTIECKALINAGGPFAEEVLHSVIKQQSPSRLKLVKGSHIIVPKLHSGDQAYVLQHKDGRVIFVIPYLKQFTLIGTTEILYNGSPQKAKINLAEMEYLCEIVNDYFHHAIKSDQIIHSWSGVRALVDDQTSSVSNNTREYKLELQLDERGNLPLLNVFGGKLTTYRALSEKAMDKLAPFFPQMGSHWTSLCPLPGGDFPEAEFTKFFETVAQDFSWLPTQLALRYVHNYGTLTYHLLKDVNQLNDLGYHFGHGLYEKEVTYLIEKEWARSLDDILWRRTKLGLFLSTQEQIELQQWLEKHFHSHDTRTKDLIGKAI